MTRSRRPLVVRIAVAVAAWVAAGVLATGTLTAAPAVADASSAGGSAVTVDGTGPFASLKLSVSQTAGLIDQVVKVSWSGATPTQTNFAADYLQIMQCWSDDPTGPSRDQCEFGNSADTRGGPQVTTRQLDAGTSFADPNETQHATPDNPYNTVPFESAMWADDGTGTQIHPMVPGDRTNLGTLFDAQSSNELPLNATGSDGTGEAYFETLTAEEAPGLGCGSTTTQPDGTDWSPKCWMVVVPRGETEVNGAPSSDNGAGLVSSPLSASNWANRIVIPLQFNPLGLQCPIGSPEHRTSGQEVAEEAMSQWQAALCQQSGTVFSYSEVSDDAARRQLLSASPGLDFVTQPVPAGNAASSGLVYAPVAVSGAVIGFNIDYSKYGSNALRPLAGQRVQQMNLTPRLVAKLLTQSYQSGAPPFDPAISAGTQPLGLGYDPDFAAANPALAGLDSAVGDVLMPFGPSDLIQELWTWVDGDPAAKAFLDGTPDPWGMTVNPAYLRLTDASIPSDFPKQDTYCQVQGLDNTGSVPPPLCTLDDRPYAQDMHDAARNASRGNTLARSQWDPTLPQPHYKQVPPQISGQQGVIAFTDAATATRYSLTVANLENSAGQFMAPTAAALTAGVAAMTPSGVAGVLSPNPESGDPAAYPLTSITYAATNPAALTPAARSSYADFVQYAATGGQRPGLDIGELPFGYLPLTQPLVTQALEGSVALRNYVLPPSPSAASTTTSPAPPSKPVPKATKKPKPKPVKTAKPKPAPATTTATPPTTTATPPTTTYVSPPTPVLTPAPVTTSPLQTPPADTTSPAVAAKSTSPPAATAAAPAATQSTEPVADIVRTPAVAAGDGRWVAVLVLGVGGLCALSGPTLLRFGRRRPH